MKKILLLLCLTLLLTSCGSSDSNNDSETTKSISTLDYPPNTKIDRNGKFSNDFAEITLANTDKGLFLRSFHVKDLTLYQNNTSINWTNDKTSALSIWPDKSIKGFDYSPTVVEISDGTEYMIDLDMNR